MSYSDANKSIHLFFLVEFDFRIHFCVAPRKSAKNDEKPIEGAGTWRVVAWGQKKRESYRAENKSIDVFFRIEFDFRIHFCVAPRKLAKNDKKTIGGVGTGAVGPGGGRGGEWIFWRNLN